MFIRFKSLVSECEGGAAHVEDADFNFEDIPVFKGLHEIGLHVDGGQADAVFVYEVVIGNPQVIGEEVFHGGVEEVEEPGVVDNAGAVDVGEPDFLPGSECHFFYPPAIMGMKESSSPSLRRWPMSAFCLLIRT